MWVVMIVFAIVFSIAKSIDTTRNDIQTVLNANAQPYANIGSLIFRNNAIRKNGRHKCVASVVQQYGSGNAIYIDLLTAGHCMCLYRDHNPPCLKSWGVEFYQKINKDRPTTALEVRPTHVEVMEIFYPLGWTASESNGDLAIVRMKGKSRSGTPLHIMEDDTATRSKLNPKYWWGSTTDVKYTVNLPVYRYIVKNSDGSIQTGSNGAAVEANDGFRMKEFVDVQTLKVTTNGDFFFTKTEFTDHGMSGAPLIKQGTSKVVGTLEGWDGWSGREQFVRFDKNTVEKIKEALDAQNEYVNIDVKETQNNQPLAVDHTYSRYIVAILTLDFTLLFLMIAIFLCVCLCASVVFINLKRK